MAILLAAFIMPIKNTAFASFSSIIIVSVVCLLTIAFTVIISAIRSISVLAAIASACLLSVAISIFCLHVKSKTLKEHPKFSVLHKWVLATATSEGSKFCGANLSASIFKFAKIQGANFADSKYSQTNLTHVIWEDSKGIDFARFSGTVLQNRQVRHLLVAPKKGYGKDFTDLNLRGVNLAGAILEESTFKRAILSEACLEKAFLKGANLTEPQAIGTNFTGACLTGATIQYWNISRSTTLQSVDCQYVFLSQNLNAFGYRERCPYASEKIFSPGDFEKIFQAVPEEMQILIRNGIEPIAFRAAFEKIRRENLGITTEAVRSIEKQGSDVKVTLRVPEGTDKAKVERDWDQGYQAGLKAGKEAERLESGRKFEELAFLAVQRDISIQNKNEVMTGDNQSKNINIQGSVSQSSVVAGDNNEVTNQIEKLGATESQGQLKDLLIQLKSAIAADPILNEEDQTDALTEIATIAQLAQSPNDETNQRAVKRSLNTLRGIILGIGEVTHLTETAKPQLEAIAHLFNL